MAFFRSEKMTLCEMVLHIESAFDCMVELGYMGVVQFNFDLDVNIASNQIFLSEINRLHEIKGILKRLQEEIDELDVPMIFYPDVDKDEIPRSGDTKVIERLVHEIDTELLEVEHSYEDLKKMQNELSENYHVLKKCQEFITGSRNTETVMAWSNSVIMSLIRDETRGAEMDARDCKLSFFTGTIEAERLHTFELMLYRICHGGFYLRYDEIPEVYGEPMHPKVKIRKYVFMLFFVGEVVRVKILKICQGFHAQLFECPESNEERLAAIQKIETDLDDIKIVIERTDDQRRRILLIAGADLFIWKVKTQKMMMVYQTLNSMGTVEQLNNQKYLQAECWIPTNKVSEVRRALTRGAVRASQGGGMMFPPIITKRSSYGERIPPTYFELNKFTRGFQNLIDSYGIAVYQELNPAPYTIITFPFLFAVMFGDMGHGIIMTLFGTWMVIKETELERKQQHEAKPNEIWTLLFSGRYIILLMGIFSIYTGFIYNDIFSKSFNVFGSQWRVNYTEDDILANKHLQLDPARADHYLGVPYAMGIDPAWDASGENAIITMNSYKMKMAIILGVTQMIFGLGLSAWNFVHQDNYVDLYLVMVPQMCFLLSLFFYLEFLVFYKWANFGGDYASPFNAACAPSILITFIDMILMKRSDKTPAGCRDTMFDGQKELQMALVFLAFLCVPILLAGKPLYIMRQQRALRLIKDAEKKARLERNTLDNVRKSLIYSVQYSDEAVAAQKKKDVDHIELTEVWIHQGIHCIESILGSVSHTASYLRLWALSLAHDQLSTVLWNMVLAMGLVPDRGYMNSIVLYLVFWFWAVLTIAILVVMEGLSAFLHTLRLHWVEFQSKFYEGAGELFRPFRFPKSTRAD